MSLYGYNLPSLNDQKFKTDRDNNKPIHHKKHTNSPRKMKKFCDHNLAENIYSSYIKDECKNEEIRYGAATKAGYNPGNPLKVNQDSYITLGDQK